MHMIIYLAGDHAGFELKEKVKKFLIEKGYTIEDCGPAESDEKDDYPDFIHKAAVNIARDQENVRGIIFGGSGEGEAMVANRYRGVRAAVYYGGSLEIIALSREHNNANILSLGARFLKEDEALRAISLWLTTSFSGEERHVRRINKIEKA